jgi:hypothetical protein
MTRTKDSRSSEILAAVKNLVVDDLLETTDAELLAEAQAAGEDVRRETDLLQASLLERLVRFRQQKLAQARANLAARQTSPSNRAYPAADVIRRRMADLLSSQASLSLAFRNRQSQSEEDLKGMWDDLIDLGLVSDHDIEDR